MRKRVTRVLSTSFGTGGVYSSRETYELVGEYDQLGVEVVVDQLYHATDGTATFDLYIDHSSDGRNWIGARDADQGSLLHQGPGQIEMTVTHLTTSRGRYVDPCRGVSCATGTAVTGGPLLHFVRFFLVVDDGIAHARVHVFQRDL